MNSGSVGQNRIGGNRRVPFQRSQQLRGLQDKIPPQRGQVPAVLVVEVAFFLVQQNNFTLKGWSLILEYYYALQPRSYKSRFIAPSHSFL